MATVADPTGGDHRWRKGTSGNPAGRPAGIRNKAIVALDAIGEANAPAVLQAVVAAAKSGDTQAASVLLSRVWPARKGRPVPFDLPALTGPADLPVAMQAVSSAVADGTLSPDEGAAVAAVLDAWRRAIETNDLAQRIEALERAGGAS